MDADAARVDVAVCGGAWRCVRSPMATRYPRMCRSALDDFNGTFKNEIGAIFATVMQRAVVCAVWHFLTTAAAGSEPKDDDWMTSEVQRQEATEAVVMAEAFSERRKSY